MAFTINIKIITAGGVSRTVVLIILVSPTLANLERAILAKQNSKPVFHNVRNIYYRNVALTEDGDIDRLIEEGFTYRVYFYKLEHCPGLCDVYLFEDPPSTDTFTCCCIS